MKRIYCSLLVVMFVLLSPLSVYASTTESMLMYAVSEDEYAVMPLADLKDSFRISTRIGVYNVQTDTYTYGSSFNFSSNDSISNANVTNIFDTVYDPYNYFAVEYTFSDFSSPLSPNFRILMNPIYLDVLTNYNLADQHRYYLQNTAISLFSSKIDVNWTGTLRNGTTHLSSNAFSSQEFNYTFLGSVPNYANSNAIMWDSSSMLDVPDPSEWEYFVDASSGSGNDVYNVSISDFTVTFVIPLSSSFREGSQSLLATYSSSDNVRLHMYINKSGGLVQISSNPISDSSGVAQMGSNISNSINNLSSSISSNFNSVKTQVTQSTNTITTKIDTMANDVKTGLQNVVTSAQQNTQNIINTVTTKVDEVKTSVGEVKDAVVDLPNKLEEKAIGLVVPEDEVIADKFDDFTGTLEQELGILYEVPQMVYDLGDTITSNIAEPQKQMTFPALSLSMPDGQDYQIWGDIVFDIMPAGMEILQDFCMTITGLIMVTATVNAIKEQYELFIRDQKGR